MTINPELLETIRVDPTLFVASILKDRIAINSFEIYPERRDHLILLMMLDAQNGTGHVRGLLHDTEAAKENADRLTSEILDGNLMRVEVIDKMMVDLGEEVDTLLQQHIARRKDEEDERQKKEEEWRKLDAEKLQRGRRASRSVQDEAERVRRRRERIIRNR